MHTHDQAPPCAHRHAESPARPDLLEDATFAQPGHQLDLAKLSYLAMTDAERADFWQWIRSGQADEEARRG